MIDFETPHVTAVRHVRDHVLWLRFSDGLEGTVDLGEHVRDRGPVFEPLRDPDFFARATLADSYTVGWPNGVDLAPEFLFDRLRVAGSGTERLQAPQSGDDVSAGRRYDVGVPEISRFFGIVITMLYDEHAPPHFHARYGEYEAAIGIRDGHVVTRHFPGRALRLVLDWRELNERGLVENWERMLRGEPPTPIVPLD
jgi:hypothetical protein